MNRFANTSLRPGIICMSAIACTLVLNPCQASRTVDSELTENAGEPDAKLNIGDPAPTLDVDRWLKGEPAKRFEDGRIYVIEFWATWCGACVDGIPHLSDLQRKYRDQGVTIIGVATDEEHAQKVERFVTANAARMDYHVAIDRRVPDGNGRNTFHTKAAYMGQTGMKTLPCAYVIDRQGRLAWFGETAPYVGLMEPYFDFVLDDLANGRFDPQRQRDIEVEAAQFKSDFSLAKLREPEAWQAALKDIARYRSLHPAHADDADWKEFLVLLFCAKDYDAAYSLANRWLDRKRMPNADIMRYMAQFILDDPRVERRDFRLALRAAKVVVEKVDPGYEEYCLYLAQVARAHAMNGELDDAIRVQQQAIESASKLNPSQVESLQAVLEQYRETKGKP